METVRINLNLSVTQHDALKAEADRLGVSVQALIRRGIVSVTGEADPLHTIRRRGQKAAA